MDTLLKTTYILIFITRGLSIAFKASLLFSRFCSALYQVLSNWESGVFAPNSFDLSDPTGEQSLELKLCFQKCYHYITSM